jgi:hypothetical protein
MRQILLTLANAALLVLTLIGFDGCRSSCATSAMTLHVSWSEPAADDEAIHVIVPTTAVPVGGANDPESVQVFSVMPGAVQQDVEVNLSHFSAGPRRVRRDLHRNLVRRRGARAAS